MLRLRRVNSQAIHLAAMAERWSGMGLETALARPSRAGRWLPLGDEQRRWHGWLEHRDCLRRLSPQLAGLASGAASEGWLAELIAASAEPQEWPMPELVCRRLRVGAAVAGDALPAGDMLRVETPLGELWLDRVEAPQQASAAWDACLRRLPFPLSFVLGHSRVSLGLLRSVAAGDCLLIQDASAVVACHGQVVGRFQQLDEGITMTWQQEDMAQDEEQAVSDFQRLPVRVEFVLQRSQMTLEELQSLCQGSVLPLEAEAQRRVEVRANGALLGRGELVQLDGRMGVELEQWLGSADDVE